MNEKPPLSRRLFESLGIIVPAEWDANGIPSAWAISTYDENYYPIDSTDGEGQNLGSFSGRKIRVYGHLNESRDGSKRITVEKYVVLDDLETTQ